MCSSHRRAVLIWHTYHRRAALTGHASSDFENGKKKFGKKKFLEKPPYTQPYTPESMLLAYV
jgi:hypothetical protein